MYNSGSRFAARVLLVIAFLVSLASWQVKGASAALLPDSPNTADASSYHSPYTVKYSFPEDSLIGDIVKGARGNPELESTLVLDSHGQGVKDSKGVNIPAGIHLRPFHENSWYFKCASHALRVLHDERPMP